VGKRADFLEKENRETMTQAETFKAYATQMEISAAQAEIIYRGFAAVVMESLNECGAATLPGLGKLYLVTRAPRKGTSPRGGEYEVPARKAVKFRACKALKALIAG